MGNTPLLSIRSQKAARIGRPFCIGLLLLMPPTTHFRPSPLKSSKGLIPQLLSDGQAGEPSASQKASGANACIRQKTRLRRRAWHEGAAKAGQARMEKGAITCRGPECENTAQILFTDGSSI